MLKAICFTCFLLAPTLLFAGDGVDVAFSVQELQIRDSVSSKLSAGSQWVFLATDAETGDNVAKIQGGENFFIPGSLLKLFVTGAVLERNVQQPINLQTVLTLKGKVAGKSLKGDLIIRGAGNSFLSGNDLLVGIEKIKALGVKEVTGDIIVDDSLFDVRSRQSRYPGAAYASPSAIGLDMHTVSIAVEGSEQRVEPPNDAVRISLQPSGSAGVRQIDDLSYAVTGIANDASIIRDRFPLADPALYAGGTFLTLLTKSGIMVTGSVKRELFPSPRPSPTRGEGADGKGEGTEIIRMGSKTISEYIQETNRHSLNTAADNLLFLLGAEAYGKPGTREKGFRAVKDFLNDLGVPTDGLVIDDGGGVSKLNRVSAGQLVAYLRAVSRKSWFPVFYDSLSRPGFDGRLKDFGYRSERIRAKAGHLPEAFGLAGYVEKADGKKTAFAFMVNGSGPDISQGAPAAAAEALRILESEN